MAVGPNSPEDGPEIQGAEATGPEGGESQGDSSPSGFAVPRWARSAADPGGRAIWRARLRRRVIWAAAGLLLLFAIWSNYPFIPNPWAALFRQPDGNATAASTPGRWAMYGANAQGTNFIPEAAAPQGIVAYAIEVDGGVRSAPAVADGVIFIGGQSRIAAYEAETGGMLWERPVSGPAHGTPAVAEGRVYLGLLGKQVLALDPDTGRTRWEYEGGSPFPGTVTVKDGILYASSRGGDVHALDAESGSLLWKVDAGGPVVAPVAVHGGKMFAASTAGVLYIRNSGTGDKRARIRTGSALVTPPVVAGDRVYLLSEGDLLAFDATVRELPGRYPAELIWAQLWIWHFPLPPPPEHSGLQWRVSPDEEMGAFVHPPAVTEEALYLGTEEGEVVALDPASGGLLWRMSPASELRRVDGNLWWRMPTGGPVAAPPLVVGDTLVVAHEDGSIRAIDRFSREEAWALSLGSPVVAPLSYAAGAIYAHTQDGALHVIR